MILIRLLLLPFRLLFGTTKLAAKTSYRAGRLVGYHRMFFFGAGVLVGLLIAPEPGRELRRRILESTGSPRPAGSAPPSDDLASRVRNHLRQAPRTWHLPQPVVTEVAPGRVRLDGTVADDTARTDLETAVSEVEGVEAVDNNVRVGTAAAAE